MEVARDRYEKEYGVSFDLSEEEYNKLTDEQKAILDKAFTAFGEDEEVAYLYNMQINLILLISSISIFLAYFILEFVLPLFFKNGQTVGKKILDWLSCVPTASASHPSPSLLAPCWANTRWRRWCPLLSSL
jgi:hypothetical protein